MIYFLYGEEEFLIDEEIKKIIKKTKINDIYKYDMNIDNIKDAIDCACTISLFEEKKVIIVKNIDIYLKEKDTSIFEEFINNITEQVVLILVGKKIDEKKKITKILKSISETKEFNKTKSISNTVKKMFDDYKIDYKTIDTLIAMSGSDLRILYQEVEKLKTYKTDKIMTEEDVINLASTNDASDIFDLINSIVNKDKEKSFKIYNNLIKRNEEPIKIIITLANQFRLIFQSKELYKKGNREESISKILNVHPYRVKLALEKGKNYSTKLLLEYLLKLANIDSNIKKGLIDKNLALELFILEN